MGTDPLAGAGLEWIGREPAGKRARAARPAGSKHCKQSKQGAAVPTVKAGLVAGWTRATVIVRDDTLRQVKALAAGELVRVQDVVEAALSAYLSRPAARRVLKTAMTRYRKAERMKQEGDNA